MSPLLNSFFSLGQLSGRPSFSCWWLPPGSHTTTALATVSSLDAIYTRQAALLLNEKTSSFLLVGLRHTCEPSFRQLAGAHRDITSIKWPCGIHTCNYRPSSAPFWSLARTAPVFRFDAQPISIRSMWAFFPAGSCCQRSAVDAFCPSNRHSILFFSLQFVCGYRSVSHQGIKCRWLLSIFLPRFSPSFLAFLAFPVLFDFNTSWLIFWRGYDHEKHTDQVLDGPAFDGLHQGETPWHVLRKKRKEKRQKRQARRIHGQRRGVSALWHLPPTVSLAGQLFLPFFYVCPAVLFDQQS